MHLNVPLKISGLAFIKNVTNLAILSEKQSTVYSHIRNMCSSVFLKFGLKYEIEGN